MDDLDVEFILEAIDFVAENGALFLPLYDFDLNSGSWQHRDNPVELEEFSLDAALKCSGDCVTSMSQAGRINYYREALRAAGQWAADLKKKGPFEEVVLDGELGELQFFALPAASLGSRETKKAG